MSDIKPFNCASCDKLLTATWQVECDEGFGCTQCGLPFENGEVQIYD